MKSLALTPLALLVALECASLVSAVSGRHLLWPFSATENLSEAIALRDASDALRHLAAGADPNARGVVRAGWLDSEARSATPLEAAVYNERPELVELLLTHGATLDAASWRHLRCAAAHAGRDGVLGVLDRAKPTAAAATCTEGEAFW